jgi:hypothetical protein
MTVRDKSQNGACKARRSGGGLVEERKQPCGFLALRPAEVIPPEISGLGFNCLIRADLTDQFSLWSRCFGSDAEVLQLHSFTVFSAASAGVRRD